MMKKIKKLLKDLPIDDIELIDYKDGRYSIVIISDSEDKYSPSNIISLMCTKDDTKEIDSLIKILNIFKIKIKDNNFNI